MLTHLQIITILIISDDSKTNQGANIINQREKQNQGTYNKTLPEINIGQESEWGIVGWNGSVTGFLIDNKFGGKL